VAGPAGLPAAGGAGGPRAARPVGPARAPAPRATGAVCQVIGGQLALRLAWSGGGTFIRSP
ncbi:hypothetical protein ABZS93_36110, partial [Streptomyces sp900116325]|uniref:hypothetical protein n=1 Tax=Streptomyces sp. 900116325 TaxID=3154295 RepID=UPI00339E7016